MLEVSTGRESRGLPYLSGELEVLRRRWYVMSRADMISLCASSRSSRSTKISLMRMRACLFKEQEWHSQASDSGAAGAGALEAALGFRAHVAW